MVDTLTPDVVPSTPNSPALKLLRRCKRKGHYSGDECANIGLVRSTTNHVAEAARPPRPAVAATDQSLPRLGQRDHAATNPGRHGHRLLPTLYAALSRHRTLG